jgi:glycosyltransferase involved in cell wall biosynthesis
MCSGAVYRCAVPLLGSGDRQEPVISAIVIARDDEARIERSVRSLVDQRCEAPFEVIVAVSGSDRTAEIVRDSFPAVNVVQLAGTALPGRARNAGLARARGRFVTFPGSHVELMPGSLRARLAAHQAGWPMVTGTTLNGTRTRSGWASYFLEHAANLPGRPSGPLADAPTHCSYDAALLRAAGGFREDMRAAEDTIVNGELFDHGARAFFTREAAFVHRSPCRTPRTLLVHHFRRGRGLGKIARSGRSRPDMLPRGGALRQACAVVGRVSWTTVQAWRWGRGIRHQYILSLPLVAAAALSHFCGLRYELARGQ